MTMFWYYAFHTIKNQIKKLFKTWMLIFIVACMLFGGIIGAGAAFLFDDSEVQPEVPAEEIVSEEETEQDLMLKYNIIELVAGGTALAMFTFFAISSDKNGSAIFQPADVCILFPSPLKPQSVLMFRVISKLGAAVFAGIYMLIQLPNLTMNLGLSIWAALFIILAWSFLLIIGELLNVFLYSVGTTYSRIKPKIRPVTYAVLGIIGASYFAYWKTSGLEPFEAACGFFNSPVTRHIPIWGWIKGICMYPIEDNYLGAAICAALLAVTAAGLVWLIWHIKADFYEDAMAKSEETAELLAAASQENGVSFRRRKKDRDDKLLRDGMKYGSGANAFFFKSMYNRFRFAHLHIFTKTTELYLVAAVAAALASKYIFEVDGLLITALALAAIAFFRSLGNPFEQDLQCNYFRMVPESTWKKLLFSLLGGSANCLLDLVPGMLVATIIMGASPLSALAWVLFIVSIDFYSTNVGTFISTSVPVSAGKMIKQFVQITFIYFGLLPDIGIIAVGFSEVVGAISVSMSIVIASFFNVIIGLLFFLLIPLFIEPRTDRPEIKAEALSKDEQHTAKKCFSRVGFSIFTVITVASGLQLALIWLQTKLLLSSVSADWSEWLYWLMTFAPIYVVAVPLGILIMKKLPAKTGEAKKIPFGNLAVCGVISVSMMYIGNLAGTLVTTIIQAAMGMPSVNPLMTYAMSDSLVLKILFLVILAPLIEEFVFRKQIIDRIRIYGEKQAVLVSALVFALFHGNLSQFFYAFTLGLLFGYVYLRSNKLRYSVGLHMFINFIGSVIGPAMLEYSGFSSEGASVSSAGTIAFAVYSAAIALTAVVGVILLCIKARKIYFESAELELAKETRFKTVFLNAGMTFFVVACLALIASTFIAYL